MFTPQAPPTDFEWCADSIRALRDHLGQSQAALAKELGIRQQTVSEWETGMYKPRGASITILTLLAVSAQFPFEKFLAEMRIAPGLVERVQRTREEAGLSNPAPRRSPDQVPDNGQQESPRREPPVQWTPEPRRYQQGGTPQSQRPAMRTQSASRASNVNGRSAIAGHLPEFPM